MLRDLVARRMAGIDRDRLALFGALEKGERPIEHLGCWVMAGWPMPPIGGPLDPRRDMMFIPASRLDEYLGDGPPATFGVRSLLVIALVTDRRLLIRPLDAERPAPKGQRYATFEQLTLGVRAALLHSIEGVTLLGSADWQLPGGKEAGLHLRVIASSESMPMLDGPPVPSFHLPPVSELEELYGPEPGMLLTVEQGLEESLLDFLLGMDHAAVPFTESSLDWRPLVDVRGLLAVWQEEQGSRWLPLYERLG